MCSKGNTDSLHAYCTWLFSQSITTFFSFEARAPFNLQYVTCNNKALAWTRFFVIRMDCRIYSGASPLVLILLWWNHSWYWHICWAKPTHGSALIEFPNLASVCLLHYTCCRVYRCVCQLLLHMSFKAGSKMTSKRIIIQRYGCYYGLELFPCSLRGPLCIQWWAGEGCVCMWEGGHSKCLFTSIIPRLARWKWACTLEWH